MILSPFATIVHPHRMLAFNAMRLAFSLKSGLYHDLLMHLQHELTLLQGPFAAVACSSELVQLAVLKAAKRSKCQKAVAASLVTLLGRRCICNCCMQQWISVCIACCSACKPEHIQAGPKDTRALHWLFKCAAASGLGFENVPEVFRLALQALQPYIAQPTTPVCTSHLLIDLCAAALPQPPRYSFAGQQQSQQRRLVLHASHQMLCTLQTWSTCHHDFISQLRCHLTECDCGIQLKKPPAPPLHLMCCRSQLSVATELHRGSGRNQQSTSCRAA